MTKLLFGDFSKLPLLVMKKVGKEPLSPNSGNPNPPAVNGLKVAGFIGGRDDDLK
jgi:hypothetical protein